MVRCGVVGRLIVIGVLVLASRGSGFAQAPAPGGAAGQPRIYANMLYVMRGILYPASNVIFTVQSDDPTSFKPAARPSTSSDPLTSVYGGWDAVGNAGFALAEAANLLIVPGRTCSNGRVAPVQNADWQMFVQEVRDAGMQVVKLAEKKDSDAILDTAQLVADSCLHCHNKYRNNARAGRC
ncbi:MAG: hypothetical protein HY824_06845 [Acidobacteria bacterium]|nr:hypothetical protein [Acidobacteriota bacterium]